MIAADLQDPLEGIALPGACARRWSTPATWCNAKSLRAGARAPAGDREQAFPAGDDRRRWRWRRARRLGAARLRARPAAAVSALLVPGRSWYERQAESADRAAKLKRVDAITFHGHPRPLWRARLGWSRWAATTRSARCLLDKRPPRAGRTAATRAVHPRIARRRDGAVSMLPDDGRHDAAVMAAALRALPRQQRPSDVVVPGLLEGLKNVSRLTPLDRAPARPVRAGGRIR